MGHVVDREVVVYAHVKDVAEAQEVVQEEGEAHDGDRDKDEAEPGRQVTPVPPDRIHEQRRPQKRDDDELRPAQEGQRGEECPEGRPSHADGLLGRRRHPKAQGPDGERQPHGYGKEVGGRRRSQKRRPAAEEERCEGNEVPACADGPKPSAHDAVEQVDQSCRSCREGNIDRKPRGELSPASQQIERPLEQKTGENAKVDVVPALVEGVIPVDIDASCIPHIMVIGIA